MKVLSFLILSFLMFLSIGIFAQTNFEPYFIYQKDAKIKIGHFNKRQLATSYTVYTVKDVKKTDTVHHITLSVETLDRYHNTINSRNFEAKFWEGEMVIEKLFLMSIDTLASISETDYQINGRDFIIPAFLANGISLSSAWVELIKEDNTRAKISEYSRIVDSFEKIKTSIGVFDACVISSKLELRYDETELLTVYTWYSKGIGPVRTNYYNTKRKLVRYSEIVELNIPGKA